MFLILRLEDEAWGEFRIFDLLLFVLFMWLKVDENAKTCGICKKLSNNVIVWFVPCFSYFIHILCTVLLLGITCFHWHLYCVTFHNLEWSKEFVLFSFPQHYIFAIFASSFYVNLNIIEYQMLNVLWCCSTSEYFTQWPLAVLVYFISYYIFLVYYLNIRSKEDIYAGGIILYSLLLWQPSGCPATFFCLLGNRSS